MGNSNWSDAAYNARQNHRQATKQTAFSYDQDVRASGVLRILDQMNPRGVPHCVDWRRGDAHAELLERACFLDRAVPDADLVAALCRRLD